MQRTWCGIGAHDLISRLILTITLYGLYTCLFGNSDIYREHTGIHVHHIMITRFDAYFYTDYTILQGIWKINIPKIHAYVTVALPCHPRRPSAHLVICYLLSSSRRFLISPRLNSDGPTEPASSATKSRHVVGRIMIPSSSLDKS